MRTPGSWPEQSRDRRAGWARALAAVGATALVAGCAAARTHTSATSSGIPRELLAQARPIGVGPRFRPPATGPVIGQCRRQLGPRRYGVHVEVFGANRVVIVPAGIGMRPPVRVSSGRVSSAGCYGSLVTLEPTGVVLVRPGSRLLLSDLFRSWGEPLSARRVASFVAPRAGQIAVFVGGRRWSGVPGRVPLTRHAEIVVEAGPMSRLIPPIRFRRGGERPARGCRMLGDGASGPSGQHFLDRGCRVDRRVAGAAGVGRR